MTKTKPVPPEPMPARSLKEVGLRYLVVTAGSLADLTVHVNAKIDAGFLPHGPLIVADVMGGPFLQPMLRMITRP